jgi:hypothetical protein
LGRESGEEENKTKGIQWETNWRMVRRKWRKWRRKIKQKGKRYTKLPEGKPLLTYNIYKKESNFWSTFSIS